MTEKQMKNLYIRLVEANRLNPSKARELLIFILQKLRKDDHQNEML